MQIFPTFILTDSAKRRIAREQLSRIDTTPRYIRQDEELYQLIEAEEIRSYANKSTTIDSTVYRGTRSIEDAKQLAWFGPYAKVIDA